MPDLRLSLIALALSTPIALSNDDHSAHQHGVGQLNVAIEPGQVEIELVSPADDIVGFEHAPDTEADRATVGDAVSKLQGEDMFRFPDTAGCVLADSEIDSPLLPDADHDEHKHGHKDDDHAEFHAHYVFECSGGSVDWLETGYFAAFPAAQTLRMQAIAPGGQHAAELTGARNRVTF